MTIGARDLKIIEAVRDTDEPIIIFRAQDIFSIKVIEAYIYMVETYSDPPVEFQHALTKRLREIQDWQANNPDSVKAPD